MTNKKFNNNFSDQKVLYYLFQLLIMFGVIWGIAAVVKGLINTLGVL